MALSICGVTIDQTKRELKEHGANSFPIASYDDDLEVISVPWHWHEEFEFIIMTEGIASVQIENRTISLNQGDAMFINSGVLHNINNGNTQKGKCHSLVFHARLIGGSIDSIFWQTLISPVIQDKSFSYMSLDQGVFWQQDMIQVMAAAWQAIAEEPDDYENLVRFYLSKVFHLLNSNHQPSDIKQNSRERLSAERTKSMIHYMEEHYFEEISLDMIADSAMVSKSVCLRCFREIIGSTPIRYLMRYRIEKAAESLRGTDEKVNEIAMASGFSDFSYFSKCFRELKGVTPGEYRRNGGFL